MELICLYFGSLWCYCLTFGWFIILYLHDHHHIKLRATTKITKVAIIAVVDILVAVDLADYSAFALCSHMQPIVVSL